MSIVRSKLLGALLTTLLPSVALAQADPLADAVAAFQRGDLLAAETTLRAELRVHPTNADALGVLGVVLDGEKKYAEADTAYRRALALDGRSPALLNNYGNHLLAAGKPAEARPVFRKVLALDPQHANAALQLIQIALKLKDPAEAARLLDRLPPEAANSPDVKKLRKQTLYATGLAAAHAGDNAKAESALEAASHLDPTDVDILYDLAVVETKSNNEEAALATLASAVRLAPDRADLQRLLAHTAADLGYFGDAVAAWDRVLQLAPTDDDARRERAFAQTMVPGDPAVPLAALRDFAAQHPRDALGHFEYGAALAGTDAATARAELNRALELKPDLNAAHLARGLLSYRSGNPAEALPDLEYAAQRDPSNPATLDRLGQTLFALDRAPAAVTVLRKAAALAPRDGRIALHLGRALAKAGQTEESAAVMARVRELGPDRSADPRPPGLVDFLSLSPEEQLARYRTGLQRTLDKDPTNAEANVRLLELLLRAGDTAEAAPLLRRLPDLRLGPTLATEAGQALLEAGQWEAAREVLRPAGPSIDLALAILHTEGATAAVTELERIPTPDRTADWSLAQTIITGNPPPANAANATRPDLFRDAALALLYGGHGEDAVRLLSAARRKLPDDPDLALLAAFASGSDREFPALERRWPDWPRLWIAHALSLAAAGQIPAALTALDTAASLAGTKQIEMLRTRVQNRTDFNPQQALEALFPGVVTRK